MIGNSKFLDPGLATKQKTKHNFFYFILMFCLARQSRAAGRSRTRWRAQPSSSSPSAPGRSTRRTMERYPCSYRLEMAQDSSVSDTDSIRVRGSWSRRPTVQHDPHKLKKKKNIHALDVFLERWRLLPDLECPQKLELCIFQLIFSSSIFGLKTWACVQ